MSVRRFQFESEADGLRIHAYAWECSSPRAAVVIAHGAAEHAMRYERLAGALNARGYDAWALDHRGHGATALPEGLGDYGDVGWDGLVADLAQFIELVRAARPGVPAVLLGHSMGSMAAQQYVPDHSHRVAALILSGSTAREVPKPGDPPPVFEPNKAFEPGRTAYDWLSRDEAEVDKYVADPWCGFETQTANRPPSRADPAKLADAAWLKGIRDDLPVLFVAGDQDPVNRQMVGLRMLETKYRAAGVQRLDTLYYPGGRHEMLNETNRDEVTADIIAWLDGVSGAR